MTSGIKFACVKPGDVLYRVSRVRSSGAPRWLDSVSRFVVQSVSPNSAILREDGERDVECEPGAIYRLKRIPPEWPDTGNGPRCYFCNASQEDGHAQWCSWILRRSNRKHRRKVKS